MENVLRNITYGVYIISAKSEHLVGCVANSLIQITSNPKTVLVSINKDNFTHDAICDGGMFGVSILGEDGTTELIGTFGYKSSRDIDKFQGLEYTMVDDVPIIDNLAGGFTCKVIKTMDAGSHTLFLGEVVSMIPMENKNVMTYKYYQEVLKGKSPKNAPTFESDNSIYDKSEDKKVVWRCPLCGYEIEASELPDDFVCPLCGASGEIFERIEK